MVRVDADVLGMRLLALSKSVGGSFPISGVLLRNDTAVAIHQQVQALTQQLPRLSHCLFIALALIDAFDAILFDMVKASLDCLASHAQFAHKGRTSSPQIVGSPLPPR